MHNVTVHQIISRDTKSQAFMNVICDVGVVGVSTVDTDGAPVVLIRKDHNVKLLAFANTFAFDCWFISDDDRAGEAYRVSDKGLRLLNRPNTGGPDAH